MTALGHRAFRVGPLVVHRYKAMIYLGCVAGVYAGAAVAARDGLDPSRFALAVIVLLVPAFVGSRALYVLRHRTEFAGQPGRVVDRADGGSALFGGLVLSIGASVPVLALAELPFGSFWDAAGVTMLVGLVFTRIGCLMNGCCAGRVTAGSLGVRLRDVHGHWERRIPTQLLESGWGVVVLVVVLTTADRGTTGVVGAAVVLSYTAFRVATAGWRE